MRLLHVVADYAPGDLAFSEMIQALASYLPDDFRWHYTTVKSFDTIATGFVVAQLGLQSPELRPANTIIYANCAPRKDRSEARVHNEGEKILYVEFPNGVEGLIVNSGYSLSFIRDEVASVWSTSVQRGGSQFRSRDIFPPLVGHVAKKDYSVRIEKLVPSDVIPPPPRGVVGYVDSFGNLKTTYRDGDPELRGLKEGQRVTVSINGVRLMATVATGSFNVCEGEIAFAPGSSGHNRRFWEVFQRGGSAWATYGKPRCGTQISVIR